MEELKQFTRVIVKLEPELNYKINVKLAELRRINVKRTKAELIAQLAAIGLNHAHEG